MCLFAVFIQSSCLSALNLFMPNKAHSVCFFLGAAHAPSNLTFSCLQLETYSVHVKPNCLPLTQVKSFWVQPQTWCQWSYVNTQAWKATPSSNAEREMLLQACLKPKAHSSRDDGPFFIWCDRTIGVKVSHLIYVSSEEERHVGAYMRIGLRD